MLERDAKKQQRNGEITHVHHRLKWPTLTGRGSEPNVKGKDSMLRIKRFMMFLFALFLLAGCVDDAQVASRNISKAADNFEVVRRIVFINGITNTYLFEIIGPCNIEVQTRKLAVTCKAGKNLYKKHFLGLSDNISYMVEQLDGLKVSVNHYRVTFKPSAIIPEIDLR